MPAKLDNLILEQPVDNTIPIWRYMDFAKFVSLISSGSLYFPRADNLLDKYEGSIPRSNKYFPKENGEAVSKIQRLFMLKRTFISCWYASENESAAMWQLYTLSCQELAIKSSYSKLAELLPDNDSPIYLGKVKYIDYDKESMEGDDSMLPFTYKRKAFEHEKEIRAILRPPNNEPYDMDGCPVAIDVNQLIQEIYLAPGSDIWFRDAVYAVKQKFGISAMINLSSLDVLEPFYGSI